MNGEELAKLLAEGRGPAITQPTQRLSLALKETAAPFVPTEDADRHPVLLCGSLYLLGEFFNLHPRTAGQELVSRGKRDGKWGGEKMFWRKFLPLPQTPTAHPLLERLLCSSIPLRHP